MDGNDSGVCRITGFGVSGVAGEFVSYLAG